jgi:hypothetical protein
MYISRGDSPNWYQGGEVGDLRAMSEAKRGMVPTFKGSLRSVPSTLLLESGVLGSNVVQEASCLSQAIEKEGLQGGKGVNNEDGRPQHMHDPGIQQEPNHLTTVRADHHSIQSQHETLAGKLSQVGPEENTSILLWQMRHACDHAVPGRMAQQRRPASQETVPHGHGSCGGRSRQPRQRPRVSPPSWTAWPPSFLSALESVSSSLPSCF